MPMPIYDTALWREEEVALEEGTQLTRISRDQPGSDLWTISNVAHRQGPDLHCDRLSRVRVVGPSDDDGVPSGRVVRNGIKVVVTFDAHASDVGPIKICAPVDRSLTRPTGERVTEIPDLGTGESINPRNREFIVGPFWIEDAPMDSVALGSEVFLVSHIARQRFVLGDRLNGRSVFAVHVVRSGRIGVRRRRCGRWGRGEKKGTPRFPEGFPQTALSRE